MVTQLTKRNIPKAQEVEPIKDIKDIRKILQYLLGKKNRFGLPDLRDYLLFALGINIGLRAGDLLSLRIGDVADINESKNKLIPNIKTEVRIQEEKTSKYRTFEINNAAKKAILLYLNSITGYSSEDYLFRSNKCKDESITVESAHKIIKNLLRDLGIKGNYGTHSLRKSFAYHVYIKNVQKNPGILHELMKVLNHSTESYTLRYIGITKDVISDIYMNLNLE